MKKYTLYTDGSHQNYNNLAGFGGYIEDDTGEKILSFSEIVHDKSLNNSHELLGLKKGLELAILQGIKNITCYSDDMSMARLINTTNEDIFKEILLSPLQQEVLHLKKFFDTIEVLYIPRNKNKFADKLSRKALKQYIYDNDIHGIKNKPYFTSDKFLTHKQFKNKGIFLNLYKDITHHIVFTQPVSNTMDIYLVETNLYDNSIQSKLLKSIALSYNHQEEMLNIITNTLNDNTHLKQCSIFSMSCGTKGQILEDTLRGHNYISPSIKNAIIDFKKTIDTFDHVFYHRDQVIIDHLHEIIAKKTPHINFEGTPENLVAAIKELGEDDYYLGKNPQIEKSPKIKEGKNSIIELQKYYFGKFLKLSMIDTTQLQYRLSQEEKNIIVKQRMKSLREQLTSQGIKLKM